MKLEIEKLKEELKKEQDKNKKVPAKAVAPMHKNGRKY